jgi:hypothetical protein
MKRGIYTALGISVLVTLTACEAPRRERHVVVSRPAPVVREREYVRAPVVIRQAPPPVVEEVVPASPGRRYVWTSGYWTWNNRWMWQPGQWVLPPRERAAWVPGQWVDHRGDWQWVPGHWR